MAIARIAGLLLVFGSMAACKPAQIRVVSASYGAECGRATGNQTTHLAAECDGKQTCRYIVNNRFGDPFFGCPKDFSAEWRCGGSLSRIRTVHHASVAGEGYDVTLSCQQ